MAKCSAYLVVQRYGGGHRYHCPSCDISKDAVFLVRWINGNPPTDRKCSNKKTTRKVFTGFR